MFDSKSDAPIFHVIFPAVYKARDGRRVSGVVFQENFPVHCVSYASRPVIGHARGGRELAEARLLQGFINPVAANPGARRVVVTQIFSGCHFIYCFIFYFK